MSGRSFNQQSVSSMACNNTSGGQSLGQGKRLFLSSSLMSTITVICPWGSSIISLNFYKKEHRRVHCTLNPLTWKYMQGLIFL